MTHKFQKIFANRRPIIAMIHVQALPGTPNHQYSVNKIVEKALIEARIYQRAGVDAIMMENMHDVPYLKRAVGHEISTALTVVAYEVKKETQLPCGLQILAGANKAALAAAHAADLNFIRSEGFVFSHVADEGTIDADAGELLRYRKMIGAENIAVFTDVKKKHSSHSITADTDIIATAKAAALFCSDGLIITGRSTGESAHIDEIKSVKSNTSLPVLIGSGINIDNVNDFWPHCDGVIVGSYFKNNNHWAESVNGDKVKRFVERVQEL